MTEQQEYEQKESKKRPLYAGVGLILGAGVGFSLGGPITAGIGTAIGLLLGAAVDSFQAKKENQPGE
jgi:hypothetical protein